MRNRELESEKAQAKRPKSQVWHVRQTANQGKPSANTQIAFVLLAEFKASSDQEYLDFDETEYEEMVAKLMLTEHAIFDKPDKHRHLKVLYIKGLVDGKPMSKMLVDGGAVC